MPIFNVKSSFAIEAEALPAERQTFPGVVFGHLCFWAGGQQIGEYAQIVVLGSPAVHLADTLAFQGQRRDSEVDGKDAADALATIDNSLYGENALDAMVAWKSEAEMNQLHERFHRFDIGTNCSEAFDDTFAVLIDVAAGSRFVWRTYHYPGVHEVKLQTGEYESAVRAFIAWYDEVESQRGNIT